MQDSPVQLTLIDWIILATSTFVRPFAVCPLTATISSPEARVPSLAAGVLSKICTTYRQGQNGAPPPMLMPIKFWESFCNVTIPEVTVIPLWEKLLSLKKCVLHKIIIPSYCRYWNKQMNYLKLVTVCPSE